MVFMKSSNIRLKMQKMHHHFRMSQTNHRRHEIIVDWRTSNNNISVDILFDHRRKNDRRWQFYHDAPASGFKNDKCAKTSISEILQAQVRRAKFLFFDDLCNLSKIREKKKLWRTSCKRLPSDLNGGPVRSWIAVL